MRSKEELLEVYTIVNGALYRNGRELTAKTGARVQGGKSRR